MSKYRTVLKIAAVVAVAGLTQSALADPSAAGLLYSFTSADPVGTGWTQSMAPNDDGSTGRIELGFDFCFYDQTRSNLFINNNGNVTFGAPLSSFSSSGFPSSTTSMIAPFWADVDTRNRTNANTNLVWHQTFGVAGSRVFVVTWDAVGWFANRVTPTNTFQLAMAENPNQFGTTWNTAFSYGLMGWTAGTASGGGPFGGVPATVGINNGDGIRFDQLGRYDRPRFNYNCGGANPPPAGSTRWTTQCISLTPGAASFPHPARPRCWAWAG